MPKIIHSRCLSKVSFGSVSPGYFAQCPKCEEDVFSFETEEELSWQRVAIELKLALKDYKRGEK